MPAVLALIAAFAGASVAAVSPATRAWVVAGTAAVVAFESTALRSRLEEVDERAVGSWRRVELLAIPVGVVLAQLLTGSGRIVRVELVLAVTVGGMVLAMVNATRTDLDAIDRAIDLTEGMTPLQRIRLRFMSVGVIAVVCAALGAVGVDGLLDLARPAARTWSAAPVGYFLTGLVAVGVTARRAESRRWDRDGATVDAAVPAQWLRTVLFTVTGVALLGLGLSLLPIALSTVPVRGLAMTGAIGEWVTDRADALRTPSGEPASTQDGEESLLPSPAENLATEPIVPWLGDVALGVFVALSFACAVVAGRNRRSRVPPERAGALGAWSAIRHVLGVIVELLVGVWDGLRRIGRRTRGHWRLEPRTEVTELARPRWEPDDPIRRRVAAAYRRAVAAVSLIRVPPARPETPREFAGRVGDDRFDRVTALFEEARYSDHVLSDSHATAAETDATDLDA